jgi:hypothetical protein
MRAALVALALALTSCHRHSADVSADQTDAAVGVHDSGACAAITKERAGFDAGGPMGAAENCLVTKRGAWGAIIVEAQAAYPIGPPSITVQFAHATAAAVLRGDREAWLKIDRLSLFDFDGDGEEELIAEGARTCGNSMDALCQEILPEVEVFTFKNQRVIAYPFSGSPAGLVDAHVVLEQTDDAHGHYGTRLARADKTLHYRAVNDADGDGRPDFETYFFYEMDATDGDVSSYFLHGPTFLVHSLADGTFTSTDAIAMKSLSGSCAKAESFEASSAAGLFTSAVCARLRGKSVDEISQHYLARCVRIRAKLKAFAAAEAAGKDVSNDGVDFAGAGACRTEPEGGWSDSTGIPRSLAKMLQETEPLLAGGAAKP